MLVRLAPRPVADHPDRIYIVVIPLNKLVDIMCRHYLERHADLVQVPFQY